MEIQKCIKESFSVIGKEGSTEEGSGFIPKLWAEANAHFAEVAALAKKDESGSIQGIWGAMSDMSHSFQPWEDHFTKGLYLAGIEAEDDAQPPEAWTKWTIPSYEYLIMKNEDSDAFSKGIQYLNENGIELAGSVHEFNNPK